MCTGRKLIANCCSVYHGIAALHSNPASQEYQQTSVLQCADERCILNRNLLVLGAFEILQNLDFAMPCATVFSLEKTATLQAQHHAEMLSANTVTSAGTNSSRCSGNQQITHLVPVIKLSRVFVLECLLLSISVSMSLGPLAKIADSPCIKVQILGTEEALGPISTSPILPRWK